MIVLEKINKTELRKYVRLSYEGDIIGLKMYHVEPMNLRRAVKATVDMIEVAERSYQFKYYRIVNNGQPIGYVVTCGMILYSFCIQIKSRTREVLLSWWDSINKLMGAKFFVLLYQNNTRAIRFLIKRGDRKSVV